MSDYEPTPEQRPEPVNLPSLSSLGLFSGDFRFSPDLQPDLHSLLHGASNTAVSNLPSPFTEDDFLDTSFIDLTTSSSPLQPPQDFFFNHPGPPILPRPMNQRSRPPQAIMTIPDDVEEVDLTAVGEDAREVRKAQQEQRRQKESQAARDRIQKAMLASQDAEHKGPLTLSNLNCTICMDKVTNLTATHCGMCNTITAPGAGCKLTIVHRSLVLPRMLDGGSGCGGAAGARCVEVAVEVPHMSEASVKEWKAPQNRAVYSAGDQGQKEE
ncbi:MAG: hypothetical protein ACRYGG_23555 [Janthinobacterium lividum]